MVYVRSGFLFLLVLGMGCVILLWHSLGLPNNYLLQLFVEKRVKSIQRSGTEAIRTQIQPSKPKREITKIKNSQNTKRTYGQRSEQLLSKSGHSATQNRTKINMNTRKVKRHRKSDTKNRQHRTTTKLPHWNDRMNY